MTAPFGYVTITIRFRVVECPCDKEITEKRRMTMKKRTVAVVMSAAMTIGMMVTGVSVQAGVEDKTLIVGFDAEYPPFGYKDDNGEYVGFDLDLAQEVCDNLGWELVKKPINWDSKDMELNSGTIDCIWNGFTINGREDDYGVIHTSTMSR